MCSSFQGISCVLLTHIGVILMWLWTSRLRLSTLDIWVSTSDVVTGGVWTCQEKCLAGGRGPWRSGVAYSLDGVSPCFCLLIHADVSRYQQFLPPGFSCHFVSSAEVDLTLLSPWAKNKSFFFKYRVIMTRKVTSIKNQNGGEWSRIVAVPLRSLAIWVSGVVKWVCEKNAEDLEVTGRRPEHRKQSSTVHFGASSRGQDADAGAVRARAGCFRGTQGLYQPFV